MRRGGPPCYNDAEGFVLAQDARRAPDVKKLTTRNSETALTRVGTLGGFAKDLAEHSLTERRTDGQDQVRQGNKVRHAVMGF